MPKKIRAGRQVRRWLPPTALLFLLTAAVPLTAHARQQTIFVNHAATGNSDGSSWQHAFVALQDAIAASSAGDAIWIAEGTYRPDEGQIVAPGDRAATFLISHDLSLVGGFAGNETSVDAADPDAYPTILSGDLLGNDGEVFDPTSPLRDDNSERVLLLASESPDEFSVVIDGITVEGGHATGEFNVPVQRFSEIIFEDAGGGGYVVSNAEVTIRRSAFRANHAQSCGGGIFSLGRLVVRESIFESNGKLISQYGECLVGGAGGIAIRSERDQNELILDVSGSSFIRNSGGPSCGGALSIGGGRARITTSVFSDNHARSGSGICSSNRFLSMSHLVIEGNSGFDGDTIPSTGALVLDSNARAALHGSLIIRNGDTTAPTHGGAIVLERNSMLYVTNSTISDNESISGDGMVIDKSSTVFFHNSILHNDSILARTARQPGALPFAFFSEYSILNGELSEFTTLGAGIQRGIDPLFDQNYRLLPGSPAVDAGANVIVPADTFDVDMDGDTEEQVPLDLAGNPRFVMQEGSAPNRTVDLGPFEMPFTATSINDEYPDETSRSCGLAAIYPNPAATDVTAELSAPGRLVLLDLLGRRVAMWEGLGQGHAQLSLSGISSGTYFLRYGSDNEASSCQVPLNVSK